MFNKMKTLLHGTSYSNAYNDIFKEGLKPRNDKNGNWYTNVEGNKEFVYVTDISETAEFHVLRSAIKSNDTEGVIISIDIDSIDKDNLRVDENYLDFCKRNTFANGDINERKEQVKQAINDSRWEDSLKAVHMAAYKGTIYPDQFNYSFIKVKDTKYYNPGLFLPETPYDRMRFMDVMLNIAGFNPLLNTWTYLKYPEIPVNFEKIYEQVKSYDDYISEKVIYL